MLYKGGISVITCGHTVSECDLWYQAGHSLHLGDSAATNQPQRGWSEHQICCRTLEAALSFRLQEYAENRSITNVIPLDTAQFSADFLLDMSPEQAEATELYAPQARRSQLVTPCCVCSASEGRAQPMFARICSWAPSLCRKVAELEREMRRLLTNRAKAASGYKCCCCTILFHNSVIPHYCRVWDM